jgi:hypothetical protein
MLKPKVIAIWESKGGASRVSLTRDEWGYFTYRANNAVGMVDEITAEDAIASLAARVNDFQPDKNKAPMHRIA